MTIAGAGRRGEQEAWDVGTSILEKKERNLLYFCICQISGFQSFSRSGTFFSEEILHRIPNV